MNQARPSGFEPMGIPLSEIVAALDFHQVTGEDRFDLLYLVQAVDAAFLGGARKSKQKTPRRPQNGRGR